MGIANKKWQIYLGGKMSGLSFIEQKGREQVLDITMCNSKKCPMRGCCYRSRAKPNKFQSWSNFEEFCNENNGFKNFIKCQSLKPL